MMPCFIISVKPENVQLTVTQASVRAMYLIQAALLMAILLYILTCCLKMIPF